VLSTSKGQERAIPVDSIVAVAFAREEEKGSQRIGLKIKCEGVENDEVGKLSPARCL
jgi:hypothetical protein